MEALEAKTSLLQCIGSEHKPLTAHTTSNMMPNSVKLDPTDAGAHVLLSNIDAAAPVQIMMKKGDVRNKPGCGRIEVDKKVHSFALGETSATSKGNICQAEDADQKDVYSHK